MRRESAQVLASVCRVSPAVAVETVWPMIMSSMGREGEGAL